MHEFPVPVRRALRRLTRRLAAGLFLEVWPPWAVGSLFVAGTLVLVARLFLPTASSLLAWLWLAPLVVAIPAVIVCVRRVYRPQQVLALADSLTGGNGLLLALSERPDAAWFDARALDRIASCRCRGCSRGGSCVWFRSRPRSSWWRCSFRSA
jgi:hypothetical protein